MGITVLSSRVTAGRSAKSTHDFYKDGVHGIAREPPKVNSQAGHAGVFTLVAIVFCLRPFGAAVALTVVPLPRPADILQRTARSGLVVVILGFGPCENWRSFAFLFGDAAKMTAHRPNRDQYGLLN